jgi:hypothetical protein
VSTRAVVSAAGIIERSLWIGSGKHPIDRIIMRQLKNVDNDYADIF